MSTRQRSSKYWIIPALIVLVAAALVLPPLINLNRYQRRIADSIGQSLGRKVRLSSVTLRLLPRPGLELNNFVVEEDPAFGNEPTLYAPTVDASIRLISLWRGKLEIGRISLDQPSLNLVRNREGRWNIGTVLLQASHIPNAPTAQRHAGSTPRFPYIEASEARVNFKIGNEKKPFSFLNADFAMWLDNPEAWHLRMEAQPARTDLDLGLSDTGLMRLEGSLQRASTISEMPINLEGEWSNAPFGQIGRLLFGTDLEWRGDLDITANIKGNLYDPAFKTRLRVANLHRQEFTPADAFNVDATCEGGYHMTTHLMDDLTCLWPIDSGHLLLKAPSIDLEHPQPSFHVQAQQVPASFALSALRLVRNGSAPSAQVGGVLEGALDYSSTSTGTLTGNLAVHGFTYRTAEANTPLSIPLIQIASAEPVQKPGKKALPASAASLHLGNTNLDLGGPEPLGLSGDFTLTGFSLHLSGNAAVERLRGLLPAFSPLRTATAALGPQGNAVLDLTLQGPWTHLTSSAPTQTITEGTLRLENASLQPAFLSGPVEIVSAQANFFPERILWSPVSVVYHHIPASLSVTMPYPCPPAACVREFTLSAPALDAAVLQSALMGAGDHGELFNQILARLDQSKTQWPELNGTVHAGTFTLGPLLLQDANARVHISGRKIEFTAIDGHTLAGSLHAIGSMDASQSAPRYSFDAHLLDARASETAKLWPGTSTSGEVTLHAQVEAAGYSAADLARSAHGTFHWDWSHGALPSALPQLSHFDHWSADGKIANQALLFENSQVAHGSTKSSISGSITFDRKLNLATIPAPARPER